MKLKTRERGSALLLAVVITILVVGLGGAFLAETVFRGKHQERLIRADECQIICDAALDLVRLALRDWRNTDPPPALQDRNPADYAWNKIFYYCGKHDLTAPNDNGIITSDSQALLTNFLAWYKANPGNIESTAGSVVPGVSSYSALNDSIMGQLFCVWRPYGKGAYWVQVKNNQDAHGDGKDDDNDGNPWNWEGFRPANPATGDPGYIGDFSPVPGQEVPSMDTTAMGAASTSGTHSNLIDGDRQAEIVITACLPDGTLRQIEVLGEFPNTKFIPGAALLDAGTIRMQGDFAVKGSKGLVHANENLDGNGGNNATISVSADASGTNTLTLKTPPPGGINSGVAPVSIPTVDDVSALLTSQEFAPFASNIVKFDSNGFATDLYGSPRGTAANYGWNLQGGAFKLTGNTVPPPNIYFFDGNVEINGGGSQTNATGPSGFSVLASGSVTTLGNANYSAFSNGTAVTNLFVVAGGDVDLGGTAAASSVNYSGVVLAVEQVKIHGTFTMNGAVIGENLRDVHNEVTSSSQTGDANVIGTPQITYNGLGTVIPTPGVSVTVRNIRRLK